MLTLLIAKFVTSTSKSRCRYTWSRCTFVCGMLIMFLIHS